MFDSIAGSVAIGVAVTFLNYVLMDELLKYHVGSLYASQLKRGESLLRRISMWFAWPYIETYKPLFGLAQIFWFLGAALLTGGPILTVLAHGGVISFDVGPFLNRAMLVEGGMLAISVNTLGFSILILRNWGSSHEDTGERTAPPTPKPGDADVKWRLGQEDETVPQPSRVEQHRETMYRLYFWIENLEKERKQNIWTHKTTVNEEMDDLYNRFCQLEQRVFEIGVTEVDTNQFCRGYWVFPAMPQKRFQEQEQRLAAVSPRMQKRCLKDMGKQAENIAHRISTACAKCDAFSYLTGLQQGNLESACAVLVGMTDEIEQLAILYSDEKSVQWVRDMRKQISDLLHQLEQRRAQLEGEKADTASGIG